MDVTMDIEVEHQITQSEQQLTIMETYCEEPPTEETYTTEVWMRSQAPKNKVNNNSKEVIHSS